METRNLKRKTKKVIKLGILVGVKESYLFLRNVYGLYAHPFLTTKRIVDEKDFSQAILLFGLPAYLWLGWIAVLLASRIFFFQRFYFGFWAKTSFLISSFSVSFLSLFLGYWILIIFREKGKK
jgi:hypothetical protein